MLKKILKYIGIFLLTLSVAAYFIFARSLEKEGRKNEVCRTVNVTIEDWDLNRFVTENDVLDILGSDSDKLIGKNIHEIDLHGLEILLSDRSAIKEGSISIGRKGGMNVRITQRRPVMRIQYADKGFYVDETEYIFPIVETFCSYVPPVSGNIPIEIGKGFRGRLSGKDSTWLVGITGLARYLERNAYWNSQIQQIYVDGKGDLVLTPRVGDFEILFGQPEEIGNKFSRLEAFYDIIAPAEGWKKYHTVNLKYRNQIICR